MAALIPRLAFVAAESVTLIPRLAFIAQRTVGGRGNALFQHLNFNREFLAFHFVTSCYVFLGQKPALTGASAASD